MATLTPVQQLNHELADKLAIEADKTPAAFPGKFVGIANGQMVVVTDDLDELGRQLEQAEPDASRTFWFELGRDYSEVHEIWEAS
jgi:hypothetical protein